MPSQQHDWLYLCRFRDGADYIEPAPFTSGTWKTVNQEPAAAYGTPFIDVEAMCQAAYKRPGIYEELVTVLQALGI